ncbi:MAG: DUF4388 domain-containing protein [Myxococcota bacterium]
MQLVLVVEPDPSHRALWVQELRKAGFEPVVADGEWALACIEVEPLAGALIGARQWDQPSRLLVERCARRHVPAVLVSRDPDQGPEVLGPSAVTTWLQTSTRAPDGEAWDEDGWLPSRGRVEQRSFAQLFGSMVRHAFEGSLLLEDGDRKKVVSFAGGRVLSVGSNLAEESLGRILVRSGRISEGELNEALSQLQRSEGPLGTVLLQRGVLDGDVLSEALLEQTRLRFFELFSWTRGWFRVRPGGGEGEAWQTDPVALLVEGLRSHMSPSRVEALLAGSPRYAVSPDVARPLRRRIEVGPWLERVDGSEPLDLLFDRAPRSEVLPVLGTLQVLGQLEAVPARLPGLSGNVRASFSTRLDGELKRIERDRARGRRGDRALPPLPADRQSDLQQALEALQIELEGQNAYEVLETEPGASAEEVRQAFARVRRRLDPETWLDGHSAPELLREAERSHLQAVRALQILTEPKTRAAYDQWIEDPESQQLQVWEEVRIKERLRRGDASQPIPASGDPELRAEAWYRSGLQDPDGRSAALEALEALRQDEPHSLWVALRFAQLLEAAAAPEAWEAYQRVLQIDPLSPEAEEGTLRVANPEKPGLVKRLSRALRPGRA